jgi:hypothetical protein
VGQEQKQDDQVGKKARNLPAEQHLLKGNRSQQLTTLQDNATSWDNGCQNRPLLTPFLTPIAPHRARNRAPSILALGPFFFSRLRFHVARNDSPPVP